ncbi:MAG TPA: hypothetical protein DCS93_29320 [Microscillaceae bacterium]|nr:hypothetical protein [Microscillaceae bacterium]
MQTKKQSLIETLLNVGIGFFITMVSFYIVFPVLGIESNPTKNTLLTLYFTVLSIARNYFLRRHFNRKLRKRV